MATLQNLLENQFTLCIAHNSAQITRVASDMLQGMKNKKQPCCVLNFNASHQWDDALQSMQPHQDKIQITDGPLLKLLLSTEGDRTLVIDCHDSQAELVESLNSVFDANPYLQISPTERRDLDLNKANIVLLATGKDIRCGKFSEAFYSRLSHVVLNVGDFSKSSPSQVYWPEEKNSSKTKYQPQSSDVGADLGYDMDWQTPLFGKFIPNNSNWSIESGQLKKIATEKQPVRCVLFNVPTPLPKDLRYFIDSAKSQIMTVYGEPLDLRQVTFVDGGHKGYKNKPKAAAYQHTPKQSFFPVNSVTVEALLQTVYLDNNGHLQSKPGLLAKEFKPALLISSHLSRSQWHRLCAVVEKNPLHIGRHVNWPKDYLGNPPKEGVTLSETKVLLWKDQNIESIQQLRKDSNQTVVFYCQDLGLGTRLLQDCAQKMGTKISWMYTVNEDKDDGRLLFRYAAERATDMPSDQVQDRDEDDKDEVKEGPVDDKDDEKSNIDYSTNIWVPQRFKRVEGPLLGQLLAEDNKDILLLKAADLAPGLLEHLEIVLHQGQVLVEGELRPVKRRLWLLFENNVTHPVLQHAPSSYRLQIDKPGEVYQDLLIRSGQKSVRSQPANIPFKVLLDLVSHFNEQVPKYTRLKIPVHLSWQRIKALHRALSDQKDTQDIHDVVDSLIWGHFYGQDPEVRAYARVMLRVNLSPTTGQHEVDIGVMAQVLKTCRDLTIFEDVFWRLLCSLNAACLQTLKLDRAPFRGEGLEHARQYLRAMLSHYNGVDFGGQKRVLSNQKKDNKRDELKDKGAAPVFSLSAICYQYALTFGVARWPNTREQGLENTKKTNNTHAPNDRLHIRTSNPVTPWVQQAEEALRLIHHYRTVALLGPTGTGKSYFLRHLKKFANTGKKLKNKGKNPIDLQLFGPLNISPQTHTDSPDFEVVVKKWLNHKSGHDAWAVLALDEANLRDQRLWNVWRDISQDTPIVWWQGERRNLGAGHKIVVTGNPPDYVGRLQGRVMRDLFFTVHFQPFSVGYLEEKILPDLLEHYGIERSHLPAISENLAAGIEACRLLRPRQEVSIRDVQSILHTCVVIDPDFKNSKSLLYQGWVRAVFAGFSTSECQALMTWYQQRYFQKYDLVVNPLHKVLPFDKQTSTVLEDLQKQITVTSLTRDYVKLVVACLGDIDYFVKRKKKNNNALTGKVMTIFEGPSGIGKDLVLPKVLESSGYSPINKMSDSPGDGKFYVHITASTLEKLKEVIENARIGGYVVIVSEINLLPSAELEGALNDILAGDVNPGFYLFITMNSSHLSGRQSLSRAFMNRGVVCQLRGYNRHELLQILQDDEFGKQLNQVVRNCLVNLHQAIVRYLQENPAASKPTLRDLLRCAKLVVNKGVGRAKSGALQNTVVPLARELYRLYLLIGGVKKLEVAKTSDVINSGELDSLPALSHLVQLYSYGHCRAVRRSKNMSAIGGYDRRQGVLVQADNRNSEGLATRLQGHIAQYEPYLPFSNNPYQTLLLRAWWLAEQKPDLASRYLQLNSNWQFQDYGPVREQTEEKDSEKEDIKDDTKNDKKLDEKKTKTDNNKSEACHKIYGDLLCGLLLSVRPKDTLSKLMNTNNLKDRSAAWVSCLRQVHLTYHVFQAVSKDLKKLAGGPVREALMLAFLNRWAQLTHAYFEQYMWNRDKGKQQSPRYSALIQQYQYAVKLVQKAPLNAWTKRGIEGFVYILSEQLQDMAPQDYLSWWRHFSSSSKEAIKEKVTLLDEHGQVIRLWLGMQFDDVQEIHLRKTLILDGSVFENEEAQARVQAFVRLLTQGRCARIVWQPNHPRSLAAGMRYVGESREFLVFSEGSPEWCVNLLIATATARWAYRLPHQTDRFGRELTETLYYLIYKRQLLQSFPGFWWPQEMLNRKNEKYKASYGDPDVIGKATLCRYWQRAVNNINTVNPTNYSAVPTDILTYWLIKSMDTVTGAQMRQHVQNRSLEDVIHALLTGWVFDYLSDDELIEASSAFWWPDLIEAIETVVLAKKNLGKLKKRGHLNPQQIVSAIREITASVELVLKRLYKNKPTQLTSLRPDGSGLFNSNSGIPKLVAYSISRNIKYLATGIIDHCDEYGVPGKARTLTLDDYVSAADLDTMVSVGRIVAHPRARTNTGAFFQLMAPLGSAIRISPDEKSKTHDISETIGSDGLIDLITQDAFEPLPYEVLRPKVRSSAIPDIKACNHKQSFKIDTNTKLGSALDHIVSNVLPGNKTKLSEEDIDKIRDLERWISREGTYSNSSSTAADWKRWQSTYKTHNLHMLNFCLSIGFEGVCYEFNSILFAILWSLKRYNNAMRMVSVFKVQAGQVYSNYGHIVVDIYIEGRWVRFDATPQGASTVDYVETGEFIKFQSPAYPYAPPDRKNPWYTPEKNAEVQNAIKARFPQLFHRRGNSGGVHFAWSGHRLNCKQLVKGKPPFEVPNIVTVLQPQHLVIKTHKLVHFLVGYQNILNGYAGGRFFLAHAINHLFAQLFRLGFTLSVKTNSDFIKVQNIDHLRHLAYAGNICEVPEGQLQQLRDTKRFDEPYLMIDAGFMDNFVKAFHSFYKDDQNQPALGLEETIVARVIDKGEKESKRIGIIDGPSARIVLNRNGRIVNNTFQRMQATGILRNLTVVYHFRDEVPVPKEAFQSIPLLEGFGIHSYGGIEALDFFEILEATSLYSLTIHSGYKTLDKLNLFLRTASQLYALCISGLYDQVLKPPLVIPPNIKYLSVDTTENIDFRYNQITTLEVAKGEFREILLTKATFPELVTLSLNCVRFPGALDIDLWEAFKARCPKLIRFCLLDGTDPDPETNKRDDLVTNKHYEFTGITHVEYCRLSSDPVVIKANQNKNQREKNLQNNLAFLEEHNFPDAFQVRAIAKW